MPEREEKLSRQLYKEAFQPFRVVRLLETGGGYIVAQPGGLIIGMPVIYRTHGEAAKRCAELNAMHGLIPPEGGRAE